MTKLYIAGPMTGLPEFNYPAFKRAAVQLIEAGHEVSDPSNITEPMPRNPISGLNWTDWMRAALKMMLDCDAVALLPGWQNSRGARVEHFVAQSLEMETRELDDWL